MPESESASQQSAALPHLSDATAQEEISERAETVWTGGPGPVGAVARVASQELSGPHGRVAVVDGCRTPFAKGGTVLEEMDTVDLASAAAAELVSRNSLDPEEIDLSIFGVVVPTLYAPNLGREVVFRCSLPQTVPGTTVNLACASSNRAVTSGAEAILTGQCDVVLAGGAESLSNVPLRYSDEAARKLRDLVGARSMGQRLSTLADFRIGDLKPVAPAIAEYSTGLSMGEACEKMAKENGISRRAQDEIALLSHQRAVAAQEVGRFERQVVPVFPPPERDTAVTADNGVRADTSMEALAGLDPVFDKHYGTLTAGNSSPITDGGSAILLMSEEKAKALGYEPLGYLKSFAYAALDPASQLLQGPAWAAPMALDRAGLTLGDMGLLEMHEAFAAQLLSNLKAFASQPFAEECLGRAEPLGVADLERLNVNGGSIALGHPFGATGARVLVQVLFELQRRGEEFALCTVCAAGGVGFAAVLERE